MRRGENVATNSLVCAARMQSCDDVLDRRDPGEVQTPGLVDTDILVEIPQDTMLACAATSDHAMTVRRSCSSTESVSAVTSVGAPPSGW